MSLKLLGDTFDIHGGGQDLIFPHHENEIAQSCAATGKEFARSWIHNGFVTVDQEKMSKSLGNFFTIKEIFEKLPTPERVTAEIVRYFLLSTHYRSPIDFSDEALRQARAELNKFYNLFLRLEERTESKGAADEEIKRIAKDFPPMFERVMDDDFNASGAISKLQSLRTRLNRLLKKGLSQHACAEALKIFRRFGQILGLFQVPVKDWEFGQKIYKVNLEAELKPKAELEYVQMNPAVDQLVEERNEARRRKDFVKADAIRKKLEEQGVILEDKPDGTTRWKR